MSAVEPTLIEEATALVDRWEAHMSHGGLAGAPWIVLAPEVKRRMSRDIAALINDIIHRGQYTSS